LGVQSGAQRRELPVTALKEGGSLAIRGEVVIDQGREPREPVAQGRDLAPMAFGGV